MAKQRWPGQLVYIYNVYNIYIMWTMISERQKLSRKYVLIYLTEENSPSIFTTKKNYIKKDSTILTSVIDKKFGRFMNRKYIGIQVKLV